MTTHAQTRRLTGAMPDPIRTDAATVDLSRRVKRTNTVTGSPAAAAETVIATLTITEDVALTAGVLLAGWCAFTVGTNGVSAMLKLRQTGTSGTTLATSGALTVTAATLVSFAIRGFDTAGALPGQVYVLTLTVGSGSAASTVSAVQLDALLV